MARNRSARGATGPPTGRARRARRWGGEGVGRYAEGAAGERGGDACRSLLRVARANLPMYVAMRDTGHCCRSPSRVVTVCVSMASVSVCLWRGDGRAHLRARWSSLCVCLSVCLCLPRAAVSRAGVHWRFFGPRRRSVACAISDDIWLCMIAIPSSRLPRPMTRDSTQNRQIRDTRMRSRTGRIEPKRNFFAYRIREVTAR